MNLYNILFIRKLLHLYLVPFAHAKHILLLFLSLYVTLYVFFGLIFYYTSLVLFLLQIKNFCPTPLGQCPVLAASPTIISSSSDNVCQIISQGLLSYSCTSNYLALIWTSSVWAGSDITVSKSYMKPTLPSLNVNGVTLTENAKSNGETYLTSTLTFHGTLFNLAKLNGTVLNCRDLMQNAVFTIEVPETGKLLF